MPRETTSTEDLMSQAVRGRLSRRQFNRLLSLTGVSLFAVPVCSPVTRAADEQAMYFTWGGYDIPELLEEYKEKHGAYPNTAPYASSSEGLAKVKAGFVVDVIHPCNTNMAEWIGSGAIQPIDTSKLSHWNDVIPSLQRIGEKDGKHYFAAMEWGQTSIAYRPDLVDLKGEEESWGLLWDERYAKRIGVIANEGDTWWCAAIYAGVPFAEIGTDQNIEKVAALLRKQQPLVLTYFDDVTTMEQSLATGEIVAAMTWNETPTRMRKQGVPIKWAAPKEGALTWVCGGSIYSGAPRVDKAHDVINSLISPRTGKFVIDSFGYGHSNLKSFDLVSAERLAELGLPRNPVELLDSGKFQTETSAQFQSKIANLFSEIKAGF